ncbi:aspartate/ornithine carbamoyltransferase family protein [Monocercomonoides exilis]|uniref:aspartate/ornithine carbamoyltransferase family protein n=1 Tax=Monocercomonoides exilis TaxID=2049356 RepID=UPI00355A52E5|nr:aspartate/ornithine carbamoyltransferase family protein [Monocercomonoides exilis]|eukprot:MONOS_603.1-p1 / transcript=MONOS_603.1 / gene=MONOS_603 / organism=Monocercomonoides_exilis_PA203 / gene_product=aspartate/ornithine carbamoyltransferase family protein / transcript_product=aspartate/ornithine carbamoyltransferase family protein / location=Mono_scaffold00009:243549-244838(+) / protein_length=406 / sequence_SO=supercontig / SO=protein_coding / is_pseudo=false
MAAADPAKNIEAAQKYIDELKKLHPSLYEKDFLRTWDKSPDDLRTVILVAEILEELYRANISCKVFDGGIAASVFRDNSTRTRFSFSFAATLLGLDISDLDEGKSQIAHGETVRETANMISFLTEVIGIRDDKWLGQGHKYQVDVADAVKEGHELGVLPRRPCLVNLQCDEDHPTQAMADLVHLIKHFGGVENLKGKKIAMTWAYSPSYGKPLSVPQGIIALLPRFGMDVVLAHPEGYDLLPPIIDAGKKGAAEGGGSLTIVKTMEEAFKDADVVYPKSWAPLEIMQERVKLPSREGPEQKELEKRALAMNARFTSWECTEEKMKLTKDGKALYMHCLPADITGVSCKEGEVQSSVFDRYRIDTYKEASHKPYVIASMIITSKFKDPAAVMEHLLNAKKPRVLPL